MSAAQLGAALRAACLTVPNEVLVGQWSFERFSVTIRGVTPLTKAGPGPCIRRKVQRQLEGRYWGVQASQPTGDLDL